MLGKNLLHDDASLRVQGPERFIQKKHLRACRQGPPGAGGAGSAIASALLDRGVSKLAIHDVDKARRDALIARMALKHGDKVAAGSNDPSDADVVVNATPLGMAAQDPMPLDVSRLAAATFVGDVITAPELTPLFNAAREKGCRIQTGVGMFQSSVGLMADFFGAAITDSDGLAPSARENCPVKSIDYSGSK